MQTGRWEIMYRLGAVFAVSALLLASGCSTKPAAQTADNQAVWSDEDPWEGFNRAMYGVHTTLDGVLLKPAAHIYRGVIPEEGREGISNVLANLGAPVVMINSFLQGDANNGFATLWRFVLNSTFGIAGVFDFAKVTGLENRPADFGQTLAVRGVGEGNYIFLPVLGPTTSRDTFGRIVDFFADPFRYTSRDQYQELIVTRTILTVLDKRTAALKLVDDINKTSLDPYATIRSGYLQKRSAEIRKAKRAIDTQ